MSKVREKQVVLEGGVEMVSVKGMGIAGQFLGSGDQVKVKLGGMKNGSPVNDWPLGSRVRVTIEFVEDA